MQQRRRNIEGVQNRDTRMQWIWKGGTQIIKENSKTGLEKCSKSRIRTLIGDMLRRMKFILN